ncbi:hypothetical protein Pcinc_004311 [Petrolisthes cinctipes]|uniref:U-box domain-containing protein n=1 Tax=Petrolisthes cinctipes TaxID=88211 RepID=A0AAE1GFL0_PETCI|nr:hypothetical protein Pcinc_004310 [Petrolisthes cinctipes]KAK3891841.1 hypothetical protein Pcinc_004311 [Petrolisthes cinctipes]
MGIKEAQCDTCHHTHSSAAVEATQALMEVNNTNTNDHHQQQPDHPTEASIVINRVRQDLRIIYDVGQSTTRNYWSVLCSLMALFKTPVSFPDYIQCFKIAWRSVLQRHRNNHKNIQFMRLCLANDALQCLARQDIKVLGYWESAVQVVLSLVRNSDPNIFHEVFFVNSVLKKWILSVFCDKEMCSNPYIRLDMLMMIQTWCQNDDLDNEEVSEHVIAGLMELSVYMDGEYESTPGGTGLTLELSWCRVIYTLLTKGHLTNVYKAATQQIQSLSVGPEARWLARMVEFVAARTTLIKSNLQSSCMTPINALKALECCLVLLGHLLISCGKTFTCRGISRVGVVSFIKVCVIVLEVIPALWYHHANSCNLVLISISEMIETLTSSPKLQALVQLLGRDHSQEMDKIRWSASNFGFQMPVITPDEDHVTTQCPERFVDGVTQLMIESPVLLQTSQVTVDETTLVYLLLQKSPRCPFTRTTLDQHSFCRLPELQQEIHAWRTNVSTTSHHHNNP